MCTDMNAVTYMFLGWARGVEYPQGPLSLPPWSMPTYVMLPTETATGEWAFTSADNAACGPDSLQLGLVCRLPPAACRLLHALAWMTEVLLTR